MPKLRTSPTDTLFTLPKRMAAGAVGVAALSAVVWLLGPGLSVGVDRPFEDPYARVLLIVLLILVWTGFTVHAVLRDRRSARALIRALAARENPDIAASEEELTSVRSRAAKALERERGLLRARRTHRLPRWLVIGAPGSGKTTAINAFAQAAGESVPQVEAGGTRVVEWRTAGGALLIDTAGRHTTQDSRAAVDGRVWEGLLDLLKEQNPRRPVNGVLLTIGLPDLLSWTADERRLHAMTIRRRLNELTARLGLRPPVHVLCAKADMIPGFTAYFDDLTAEEREQPWGFLLPFGDAGRIGVGEAVRDGLDDLSRRLEDRLLDRLHREPDVRRRAAIFGFPAQFAAVAEPLRDLLATAWLPEPGKPAPLPRGVHFISARQTAELPPADGLVSPLGLPPPAEATLPADGPCRFFIDRVLPEALLPEADLAGEDRALEKRRRLTHLATAAGTAAVTLSLSLYWANSHRGNLALIAAADAGVEKVAEALRPLDTPPRSLGRVDDTDFASVVPALDAMRVLPGGYMEHGRWPSVWLSGGLNQSLRLGRAADALYARGLRSLLLSRVVLRYEEAIRTAWLRSDSLQPALRAYLMLGGRLPLDRGLIAQGMTADWQRSLSGPRFEATRRALADHLIALFDVGFAPVPLDEALVDRAQKALEQAPPPGKS